MNYPDCDFYTFSGRNYVPKESFDYYNDITDHNEEVYVKRISYLENMKLSAETRHTAEIKNLRKKIELLNNKLKQYEEESKSESEEEEETESEEEEDDFAECCRCGEDVSNDEGQGRLVDGEYWCVDCVES